MPVALPQESHARTVNCPSVRVGRIGLDECNGHSLSPLCFGEGSFSADQVNHLGAKMSACQQLESWPNG